MGWRRERKLKKCNNPRVSTKKLGTVGPDTDCRSKPQHCSRRNHPPPHLSMPSSSPARTHLKKSYPFTTKPHGNNHPPRREFPEDQERWESDRNTTIRGKTEKAKTYTHAPWTAVACCRLPHRFHTPTSSSNTVRLHNPSSPKQPTHQRHSPSPPYGTTAVKKEAEAELSTSALE